MMAINQFRFNSSSGVKPIHYLLLLTAAALSWGCYPSPSNSASIDSVRGERGSQEKQRGERTDKPLTRQEKEQGERVKTATFGAGCFWCVEAVFQELEGVTSVKSGYTGGHVNNPTYEQICTGMTGHAEVCKIEYDPEKISFKELLEVFWMTHDPTTLNQQGVDRGTQYRSAIFYHDLS